MAEVQIRNIVKRYGTTQVVHGVSIDIADGEFVVVVGPSGCGKSTLLRMVAGLETISEGEILIDGEVVNQLEPKDRNIAMVFQNYALYPHMSVYDNMAYGLKNRGLPRDEIREKVEAAAATLELGALLERRPSQLSGGQRQRVAMGRAIVRSPKVFLFDEPLSNLDAKLRVHMRIEIRHLQRELGITSIYVTHDQVEAMTLADRLIAMNDGRAEQIGAPMDIYERPASTFVGGFIGSPAMNFLPVTVSGPAIKVGEIAIDTDSRLAGLLPAQCTAGARPEHIKLAEPSETLLRATIELVEPLGPETLIHARLDTVPRDSAMITVRAQGRIAARADDVVGLVVDKQYLSYFAADGRAIDTRP